MPGRFSFPTDRTVCNRNARRSRSRSHATIEQLERRELLSAAIAGVVLPTSDVTPVVHGRHHTPKGQPIKLYRDMNANGILDAGDKLKATKIVKGGQGPFIFRGIKHGAYILAGQVGTTPLTTYAIDVTANKIYGGYIFPGPTSNGTTTPAGSTSTPSNTTNNTNTTNTTSATSTTQNTSDTLPSGTSTGTTNPVDPKLLSSLSFVINGTTTVSTLSGNVHEGDMVTANFTVVAGASVQLSLVSYHAPSPAFDPNTASQQVVDEFLTSTFTAGAHAMTIHVPDCYFQIDFVYGTVIQQFGPAGSNQFYSAQGRLISSAFGGDHSCNCTNMPDPASLSGRIFCDTNLNGVYDAGVDEALAGQTVTLSGTNSAGQAVNLTTTTAADGTYTFATVQGNYTLTEPEPAGHVDAKNFALVPGGDGTASQNAGTDVVSGITLTSLQNATGYDFVEVNPATISGTVWVDENNDGIINSNEMKLANVAIALTGTNDLGTAVSLSTATDLEGNYNFNVRPGDYTLVETQPAGYLQGKDIAGSMSGDVSVQDRISAIHIPGCDGDAMGYNFGEQPTPGSIAGRVFCDNDLNGTFTAGDETLAGVAVALNGTTLAGHSVTLTTSTAADGTFKFGSVLPGTYNIVESEPAGHLDGMNFAAIGTAGGTRSQASAAGPDTVAGITIANGQIATGYDFAEVSPGSLAGTVWLDANGDGQMNPSESGIANVTITITGVDDLGAAVSATTTTNTAGAYSFQNLRPGTYKIVETQPAGYLEGKDLLGTLGGDASVQDVVSNIHLPGCDGAGINYNFGEQIKPSILVHGATATIGFWHNNNGQALILALNGGPNATQLGNWLATTFPHLYSNFAGKTNSYIAAFYLNNDFNVTGQKLDAQVLAAALAVYVTNSSLAGNVAAPYGFNVNASGTGIDLINVGSNGAAFGVANNTNITVMQALLGADAQATNGTLYAGNTSLQDQANSVFDAINQGGDIS